MEAARLQASNGGIGDFFGRSIYVSGSTLLVGAPGISAVYVFEKDAAGVWVETGIVQPENLGDKMDFGVLMQEEDTEPIRSLWRMTVL